jgi:carboxyl-terminal processing protease
MFLSKIFNKKFLIIFLTAAITIFVFVGGVWIGIEYSNFKKSEGAQVKVENLGVASVSPDVDLDLFSQVWSIVKNKYYKQPVADKQLFFGSLEGIVNSLGDPYSVFLEPKQAEQFAADLAGTFEGIGAEIGIKKDQLMIVSPLPDMPAERAGLRAGDRILAINGTSTLGMSVDMAVSLIRGPKGTQVTLLIGRNGWAKAKEFVITREKINVSSVTYEIKEGNIAYVKISQFGDDTVSKMKETVRKILIDNPKGLILDLRNNPGGYLDGAINILGYWIKDSVAVKEKYYDGRIEEYRSDGKGELKNLKTIVLINQGSASGSEIVAGALADYGSAKLVGKKSFGKGSVQEYEELRGGSAIKITIAEWLTPQNRSINENGIEPDFDVDLTEEDYNNDKDPQLDKAMELLK